MVGPFPLPVAGGGHASQRQQHAALLRAAISSGARAHPRAR